MESESAETISRAVGRVFPDWTLRSVERVPQGGSTRVYRIRTEASIYFARVRPEDGASLVPEALVHQILRSQGVLVPEVFYVARLDPELGRSLMVTSAIPGEPMDNGGRSDNVRAILRAAGRDLATINRLPVDGFGWVGNELNRVGRIQAEFPTFADWFDQYFGDCTGALESAGIMTADESRATAGAIRHETGRVGLGNAHLVHGDFDGTHIYQVDGAYSGIIDFGEIRGAPVMYDLAHFQIENRDLLPHVLAGYEEVTTLLPGDRRMIDFLSLLIALRRMTRHVETGRSVLAVDVRAVQLCRFAMDTRD